MISGGLSGQVLRSTFCKKTGVSRSNTYELEENRGKMSETGKKTKSKTQQFYNLN